MLYPLMIITSHLRQYAKLIFDIGCSEHQCASAVKLTRDPEFITQAIEAIVDWRMTILSPVTERIRNFNADVPSNAER